MLLEVAARFQNNKQLVAAKGYRRIPAPTRLEAKPIYEALLSANKSLGCLGGAAAAEDVVICI